MDKFIRYSLGWLILTLASGGVLFGLGRPLNIIALGLHKLSSVSMLLLLLVWAVKNFKTALRYPTITLTAILGTIGFVLVVISGILMSLDSENEPQTLWFNAHSIAAIVSLPLTALAAYGLIRREKEV